LVKLNGITDFKPCKLLKKQLQNLSNYSNYSIKK